jgi:hypothetical protein
MPQLFQEAPAVEMSMNEFVVRINRLGGDFGSSRIHRDLLHESLAFPGIGDVVGAREDILALTPGAVKVSSP